MKFFHYKAIDTGGRKTEGVIEALDAESAAARLRDGSLFVLNLSEKNGSNAAGGTRVVKWRYFWRQFIPVKKRDIIFFFRQLALMRRTGLTVLQSLEICRGPSSKPQLKRIVDKLIEVVQSGSSLSTALAGEKKHFPEIAIKMIITAEVTGELSVILDQIAVQMERKQELKSKTLTGLMYPAMVVIIMISVVTFLVTKVVPKFSAFLAQRDVVLPASTQFLMDMSDFMITNKLTIITVCVIVVGTITLTYLIPRTRLMIDRLLLALPVIGNILTTSFMAYFGRTFSILLRSGVSLLESIHVMSEVIPNRALARHLECAEDKVLKGQSFSNGLQSKMIPSLVTEIVNVGEVTGSLDQVLDEIGYFYEKNLERYIKMMTALFEPMVILLVGCMMGFVYFAFFQVLFQLSRR